ncbi:MAG: N-acetylmuramoyl-L-alanine amidase, partial [Ferruginibacter sp.]
HGDIAPGRKVDPNVNFPWQRLADAGFGNWYNDTTNVVLPANFNALYALRIVGYDITNTENAIAAFRRHFLKSETKGELLPEENKVLFALMKKYL